MNLWRKLRDLFTFTHNEQKVLIGLALVFLAGAGIKAYRLLTHHERRTDDAAAQFDYRNQDSVFRARSSAAVLPALGSQKPASSKRIGTETGRININTAGRRELLLLPGVGESTAARILAYRAAHGTFGRESDLMRIKGIGKKKLERLRPSIFVETDSAIISRSQRTTKEHKQ